LNVDCSSTRVRDPEPAVTYRLVQGDEAVVIDFAPGGTPSAAGLEPRQLEFDTSGYVQMELLARDSAEDEHGGSETGTD
jgi:hypothetical protein